MFECPASISVFVSPRISDTESASVRHAPGTASAECDLNISVFDPVAVGWLVD